jgi:hypothetical protein
MTTASITIKDLEELDFDCVQKRCTRSPSRRKKAFDVYVYITGGRKKADQQSALVRQQVAVRLSKAFMETLGWQPGDFLQIAFNDEAGVIRLRRTTDSAEGYKLSMSGKSETYRHCCTKFTPEPGSWIHRLLSAKNSLACRVLSKSSLCVFIEPFEQE